MNRSEFETHQHYIRECLRLADQGRGSVSPNPMVGSILVRNREVLSTGFHERLGENHAERNALRNPPTPNDLQGTTLYVNLEPCSHHGRTPPCVERIIECQIPTVVYGMEDPNPQVCGRGVRALQEAGVQVVGPIAEDLCRFFNRRFVTFQRADRPYVIFKWAQTADGFMARKDKTQQWISNVVSQELVHQWRAFEDAILVGTNTAIFDNPRLTCRKVSGKNPIRVVLDRNQKVPLTHHLFDGEALTLIFVGKDIAKRRAIPADGVEAIRLDTTGSQQLVELLSQLKMRGIQSLIVEGGPTLLRSFLEQGLWDEMRVFSSEIRFQEGIAAPELSQLTPFSEKTIGSNNTLSLYFSSDPPKEMCDWML